MRNKFKTGGMFVSQTISLRKRAFMLKAAKETSMVQLRLSNMGKASNTQCNRTGQLQSNRR